jgi:hypothetical protein
VLLAWSFAVAVAPLAEPHWLAPPECPDAAELRAQIDAHGVTLDGVELRGEITGAASTGYRLALEVVHGEIRESRSIDARGCASLVRAAALVVALGVDPVALVERRAAPIEPVPRPEPVAAPPSRARPRLDAPLPASPRPSSRSPWQGWLSLGGGVERGALPGITGGVAAALVARRRGLRLELGGAWLGPRTAGIDVGAVRVQLGVVTVRGCPELVLPRASVPLCLGVELGAMRGDGRDAPAARTVHALWVAPTASAGVRLGRGAFGVLARAEVAVAAARPALELRDPGEPLAVFTPEVVSARLWLGVEFRLVR